MNRERRLEKHEQDGTVRLLQWIGGAVYVLGTRRPRGRACPCCGAFVPESQSTRQTPGIADVIAFLPAPRGEPRPVLFIEQKKAGGRLRPDQRTFREVCTGSTAHYLTGTLDDVVAWLRARGYVREGSHGHGRRGLTV